MTIRLDVEWNEKMHINTAAIAVTGWNISTAALWKLISMGILWSDVRK